MTARRDAYKLAVMLRRWAMCVVFGVLALVVTGAGVWCAGWLVGRWWGWSI